MPRIVTSAKRNNSKSKHTFILAFIALAIVIGIAVKLLTSSKYSEISKTGTLTIDKSLIPDVESSSAGTQSSIKSSENSLEPSPLPTAFHDNPEPALNAVSNISLNVDRPEPTKGVPRPLHQYFDNPIENQLASLTIRGKHFKSLPTIKASDDEILAFLRKPVEIYDDDDEKTIRAKEATAEMKTQALAFIEQGGTFQEFVRLMADASNAEHDLIEEVRKEKLRLLKEDGIDAAAAYLEEANKTLKEAGLSEMKVTVFDTNLAERAASSRTRN